MGGVESGNYNTDIEKLASKRLVEDLIDWESRFAENKDDDGYSLTWHSPDWYNNSIISRPYNRLIRMSDYELVQQKLEDELETKYIINILFRKNIM